MILKKTGASNFLWGAFVAFFIVLVTLLWYLSELLPEESRKLLAVVLSVLTITAVCLIAFAAGRLADLILKKGIRGGTGLAIAGDVAAGLLLLGAFLARIVYLSKHLEEITDPYGLYEQAMITGEDAQGQAAGLLQAFCIGILKPFLKIAGNRIIVAAVVMAILQALMIIAFYYAVRLLSGRMAAFVAAVFAGCLPAPYGRLLEINDQTLLYAVFAFTLFLIALYLSFDARGSYGRLWQVSWYIVLGIVLGFTVYLDLAAILLWIPLFLAFAIPDIEKGAEALRLLIIFAASLAIFIILLASADGGMTEAVTGYFGTYFGATNTIRIFHLQMDIYPVHIVAATSMAFLIVTFWRDRKRDGVSVWLLFFLASLILVPLFGATKLNGQELFCCAYGAVTGIGIACLFPYDESLRAGLPVAPLAAVVPEGMVLPAGDGEDDGVSRMQMPADLPEGMVLGIDRGQEGETGMEMNKAQAGQPAEEPVQLNKAAQKALARAKKEREKAEAKEKKAQLKAARKAEKERLRQLADAEDEWEECLVNEGAAGAAAAGAAAVGAAVVGTAAAMAVQANAADGQPEQASEPQAESQAAQPVPEAQAAETQPVQETQPVAAAQSAPAAQPAPAPQPAAKPAFDPSQPVSLAAISPFANRAPQTSHPTLVRNTAFNADGSDDFDYNIPDNDDFDV